MYIPTWLIILVLIIIFLIYRSRKKISVENIEKAVSSLKTNIFAFEHFDTPHFIDVQDAYDAMEVNYFRLKQRFSHNPEKVLEIASDWLRYVTSLYALKRARIMLDVDMSDNAVDNLIEDSKEPSIIKDEVEKKFKTFLEKDWQDIPPDYFQRMKTMKKPSKKILAHYGFTEWKYYYQNSSNLIRLEEKRSKDKEEKEKKRLPDKSI